VSDICKNIIPEARLQIFMRLFQVTFFYYHKNLSNLHKIITLFIHLRILVSLQLYEITYPFLLNSLSRFAI